MEEIDRSELLKIPEVVEEIKRHLWIESEKTGYDIGFEKAADDWINKYAQAWLNHYKPNLRLKAKGAAAAAKSAVVSTAAASASKSAAADVKKRRAKSYTFNKY